MWAGPLLERSNRSPRGLAPICARVRASTAALVDCTVASSQWINEHLGSRHANAVGMSLEMLGLVVLSASGAALLLAAPIALVVAWAWTWHIDGKRFDQTSRALIRPRTSSHFPALAANRGEAGFGSSRFRCCGCNQS